MRLPQIRQECQMTWQERPIPGDQLLLVTVWLAGWYLAEAGRARGKERNCAQSGPPRPTVCPQELSHSPSSMLYCSALLPQDPSHL